MATKKKVPAKRTAKIVRAELDEEEETHRKSGERIEELRAELADITRSDLIEYVLSKANEGITVEELAYMLENGTADIQITAVAEAAEDEEAPENESSEEAATAEFDAGPDTQSTMDSEFENM